MKTNVLIRVKVGKQVIQFIVKISTLINYGGLDKYIKDKNLKIVAIQY